MRLAYNFLSLVFLAFTVAAPAFAAGEARMIVTTPDSDYFGFDLRTEQNVSLDRCKAICLGDSACRAFTYNTKARWCFLKSDHSTMNPFVGAVAGKVVAVSGDPDIGAPAELSFLPTSVPDQARQFRQDVSRGDALGEGLATLVDAAGQATLNGDPRTAMRKYSAALSLSPDDTVLWTELARAVLAVQPGNTVETTELQRNGSSAAYNAYLTSRTAQQRADALAALAAALDRREQFRPALQAYEASLSFVDAPAIRSEYLDLKARKGFRIVDHSVDSDNASPRVCAQFSEALVKAGVDYAQFVTVDGSAPKSVEAEDREVCVGGLAHGKHYRMTFRSGLPAAIGEVLAAPSVLSVYVQDRAPSVRFTGDSFVLPATARRGIPVVTVNMDAASVKLYRIGDRSLAQLLSGYQFLRQLDGYDVDSISDQMGAPVWSGTLEVANELNKEVTTSFPVDEALPQRKPGVYVLTAQPADDNRETWESRATQWFVVSDIGLSTYTGQDGLNVFARSLATAKPIAGADLTLLAKNNEILGKATTDADGRATFTPGLTRGEGGMTPAVLMADRGGEDFVFLDMGRAGFDLSDRGVTGRSAPGALDVYAWTERGIYRGGETVHVAALARDDAAKAVDALPLTFIFTRPDGVEERRLVSDGAMAGGHAVELQLAPNAMRGTWQAAVYPDPKQDAVATMMFLVEDFVPDRIELDMTADKDEIAAGETAEVTVDGRFLYGAPAAGLALEGEINVTPSREWEDFSGYYFGLADETQNEATRIPLSNLPLVGDDGKAIIPVTIDQLPSTTGLLVADVTVRMREAGGRAVERSLDIGIAPQGEMIGIRPDFGGGSVPEGGAAGFKIIAVDAAGNRIAAPGLIWSLVKLERNYQWYRSENSWSYEPVTLTKAVANGTVDANASAEAEIKLPVDWGRYRLQVETTDPAGPATSYEFEAGWYVEASSTETPDGLEIALDKDSYAAGEVAKLKVSPRFAGELLVAIGAEKLLATVNATIPEGGATVDIPVGADWGAGAYVTATLFRPGDALQTRMPARAIGVKWLKVDPGEKKLDVALAPPAKAEPRKPLSIPVTVSGMQPLSDAYVTVAAVDVGILNLTSYDAPDPEKWYFGQRMLGMELRDLYGRLIDGSLGVAGRLRTGGDGAQMQSQGSPPTQKLVAFFSGPVKLDADGKATVSFDIPQFNGAVRVMAVAWTREAVGHAATDVIVRDPVVLTAGMPRFMAPGDRAQLTLDVTATDAPAGDYTLTIAGDELLQAGDTTPRTLALEPGKRQTLTIPLAAGRAGDAGLTISLAGVDGTHVDQTLPLLIRPAAMPVTSRSVAALPGNGGSITLDRELLAASLIEGASVGLSVTPGSAFDVVSLLMTLDRYPHGCSEQTTSRALPLLYVNDLSTDFGMPQDPQIHERVQKAIYRVLNNQSSSGSFGLWSPGSGDLWLDAYVTDFLTRAREKGYDVPAQAMVKAIANLQNALSYDLDLEGRGNEIAYALYVLARNKKASIGDLRYYADTKIEAFPTPLAVAHLAASLALYGDRQRSEQTFRAALTLAQANAETNYYRSDYGSRLRDGAAMLALAAESNPLPATVPDMIRLVSAERAAQKWTSTQDEAWMVLAARALKSSSSGLRLTVDGAEHSGAYSTRLTGEELAARPITVANRGGEALEAVVTTVAVPHDPLPAGGDGYTIARTYYTLDGAEANITEARQNERYVAVLKITQLNAWNARVLVNDLLPAGFEIDNPGLVSSAQLANFDWLPQTEAAHLEFRDDRFIAAYNQEGGANTSATFAYVVRAVTPGIYAHPAASVEDMYRPQFSARTASGVMAVKAE